MRKKLLWYRTFPSRLRWPDLDPYLYSRRRQEPPDGLHSASSVEVVKRGLPHHHAGSWFLQTWMNERTNEPQKETVLCEVRWNRRVEVTHRGLPWVKFSLTSVHQHEIAPNHSRVAICPHCEDISRQLWSHPAWALGACVEPGIQRPSPAGRRRRERSQCPALCCPAALVQKHHLDLCPVLTAAKTF